MIVNAATVSAALTLAVLCVFVFIFLFTVSAPGTHLLSRPAVWIRRAVSSRLCVFVESETL